MTRRGLLKAAAVAPVVPKELVAAPARRRHICRACLKAEGTEYVTDLVLHSSIRPLYWCQPCLRSFCEDVIKRALRQRPSTDGFSLAI